MLMRVTRLELFGFKSFPERSVLPLEGGITGIVGPNGCGKSNVVDALRWVLGETRASQLRGGLLEDVIFNGTDGLRPLGLAEVTLTLRANEVGYFGTLTSPMMEAKALASESGEAKESIEEDSDLAVVMELNPDGDVATLGRRFAWLQSVSEVQVTRRLYRSGESEFFINKVQCRLKDLKDFFRAVGISARSYTIVAQGEVGRIVTSKPADRRTILEEAAGVAGFREQAAEAGRRLSETLHNVTRINDIISELSRQVQILSRQAQKAERRAEIKQQVASLEEVIYFHRRSLFEDFKDQFLEREMALASEEEVIQEQYQAALQQEADSRSEYETIENKLDSLQGELDYSRSEITRIERERSRVVRESSEAESVIKSVDQDIDRLMTRAETLRVRQAEARREIEQLSSEHDLLEERIVGADGKSEETVDTVREDLRAARIALSDVERRFRSVREQYIAYESKYDAVAEQLKSFSPLGRLQEGNGAQFADQIVDQVKLLSDLIVVPQQYSQAVQSWLSVSAQFVVADDVLNLGMQFLDFLEGLTEQQREGVDIGVFQAQAICNNETTISLKDLVPFRPLKDYVEYKGEYEGLMSFLFRDVFFVESSKRALHFLNENGAELPETLVLVSATGELITRNSFFSKRHEGGNIQLKAQLDGLKIDVERYREEQSLTLEQCQELEDQIVNLEQNYQSALDNQQVQQKEVRELGRQQGSVKGRLVAVEQLLHQIGSDLAFVEQEITQNKVLRASSEHRFREAQESLQMYEEHSLCELEEKIEMLREAIDQLIGKRSELRDNFDTLRSETERFGTLLDDIQSSRSRYALEARKIEMEFENLKERVLEEQGDERLQQLDESYNGLSNEGRQPLTESAVIEIQNSLKELRSTLLRIGEVDPTAIENYRVENQRLIELKAQSEDLTNAANCLSESIERLTKTSEEKFLATFQAVRECFATLIPRLFGGGSGDLELSNPNTPLESGVDILVKPPGKKPKSIDVLSGGEKALCATALIFSLFRQRPSPLCVLDEVDAPLDEANVNRFLNLVRDTCDITQFLLITHNKVSMASADRLVGVTMPQPGASKLISVSLQEAERKYVVNL
jgi:chromosome segregation protein